MLTSDRNSKVSTSTRRTAPLPRKSKKLNDNNDSLRVTLGTSRNEMDDAKTSLVRRTEKRAPFTSTIRANGKSNKTQSLDRETSEFEMLKVSHDVSDDKTQCMTSALVSMSLLGTDSALIRGFNDSEDKLNVTSQNLCDSERQECYGNVSKIMAQDLIASVTDLSNTKRLPGFQIPRLDAGENDSGFEKVAEENLGINTQELSRHQGSTEETKTKEESMWRLDEKFCLSTGFPAEPLDKRRRNSLTKTKRTSSDLLSGSFPALCISHGIRRLSFPLVDSTPSVPRGHFPSLSGRQCKIQLPSPFPCVPVSMGESQSKSTSDQQPYRQNTVAVESLKSKHKTMNREISSRKTNLTIPGSLSNSNSLQLPRKSFERLAMRSASNEFLAARVVTQLNCAFGETPDGVEAGGLVEEKARSHANCVTPNLMYRRYSEFFSRPNTSSDTNEENQCSKSLPNLREENSKRRVFVTFDKDFPLVKVVNLRRRSALAQKCRLIDNKLNKEGATEAIIAEKKIKKNEMVQKWINSNT